VDQASGAAAIRRRLATRSTATSSPAVVSGKVSSELQLGPIVGDTFYLLQGNELIAIDVITKMTRWQNMEAPRDGAVVCDGETVAVVSPASQLIIKYDCRDGKRIGEEPFTDYRLWASTDRAVLLYRDLPEGKRELVLKNPISGETLLEHVFEGLSDNVRVSWDASSMALMP
jgi:hypothetical protein